MLLEQASWLLGLFTVHVNVKGREKLCRVKAVKGIDSLVAALESVVEVLHVRNDVDRNDLTILGQAQKLLDFFIDALVVPGLLVRVGF